MGDHPLIGDEDTEYFSDGDDEPKSRASSARAFATCGEICIPASTDGFLGVAGRGLTNARGFLRLSYTELNIQAPRERDQTYTPPLVVGFHWFSCSARASLHFYNGGGGLAGRRSAVCRETRN